MSIHNKIKTVFICVSLFFGMHLSATLTLDEDITWNVIGLDSNNVNDGPNKFPVGVRACNTGTTTETNVTATFFWDSTNNLINLSSSDTYTIDELLPGDCHDFYFEVEVTRDAAAYDTTREFHIEVTSDAGVTYSTPIGHELYVERLISQNRNSNIDLVLNSDPLADSVTVYVGETLTFTGTADTATNGYEQIEAYFGFNPDVFRIIDIQTTYSAGGTSDTLYGDGCGWDEEPSSPTYRECLGTGKNGGALEVVYTVEIIEAGSGTLGGLVYDFSGSSYHYNSDFGDLAESLTYTAAYKSNLSITKTDNLATTTGGSTITYDIVVTNDGPSPAIGASIADTFPTDLENISWTCTADADSVCNQTSGTGDINTTADIASGETLTYTITADVVLSPSGDLSNTATVTSPPGYDPEDDLTDNTATDITEIPLADFTITKDNAATEFTPGTAFTYTIVATNNGPDAGDGAVISDVFTAAFTNVTWTCVAANGAVCPNPDSGGVTTELNETIATFPANGSVTYTISGTYSSDMADY